MRTSFYLTASALAALASAQTFTDCDPTKKTCPNNPSMPAKFETNFKAGKDAVKGWKQTAGTLNYGADGAAFTVSKKGEAPTIQSEGYLHFGYVEVKMKAAPGAGIVSSIVLQSDDLDEVDWEFIGSVNSKAQMNYFGKGNTTSYDRMIEATVNNVQEMHTYALNWTAEALTWIIDNKPIRTLKYAEANGGNNYPQTPSNVRIGIWAGGDSENQGTREWAGGAPDYSKAPFTQTVESIKIINYSPGKEYQWTDTTGSYKSIKVIEPGQTEGAAINSAVISAPAAGSTAGAALGSIVNSPSGAANASSTCTEGQKVSTTAPPKPTGGKEEPCECGTQTVTVTGNPPAPPATNTPIPPKSSPTTASKPVTSAPAPSQPPYPVTSTGIKTDSRPVPSATIPIQPTGGVAKPTGGNATTPPNQFPGAASSNGVATALFGVVGVVMAMAF